jgi:hypothetical protein
VDCSRSRVTRFHALPHTPARGLEPRGRSSFCREEFRTSIMERKSSLWISAHVRVT